MNLNDLKELGRLAKFADDSELATFEQLDELSTRLNSVSEEVKVVAKDTRAGIQELKSELKKKLNAELDLVFDPESIRGFTGEKGEKGEPGVNGTNGTNGLDGANGIHGKDGANGKDGKDGRDGSSDSPEKIVAKINSLPLEPQLMIDGVHIRGWSDLERLVKINAEKPLDFRIGVSQTDLQKLTSRVATLETTSNVTSLSRDLLFMGA